MEAMGEKPKGGYHGRNFPFVWLRDYTHTHTHTHARRERRGGEGGKDEDEADDGSFQARAENEKHTPYIPFFLYKTQVNQFPSPAVLDVHFVVLVLVMFDMVAFLVVYTISKTHTDTHTHMFRNPYSCTHVCKKE